MQTTAVALSQFPVVDTNDAEIMRETMMTRYGATRFETSETSPFLGRSANAHLGSASLVMCAYGALQRWRNSPKRILSDYNSRSLAARRARSSARRSR